MEATDLERRLKIKEDLLEQLDTKNDELYNENLRLKTDKENLEKEKNDALSRLSQLAGQRLTNGNPDITDLSDPNTPVKIAERWSSLYTDEWTDAYEAIKDRNKRTNDDLEPENQLLQIVDNARLNQQCARENQVLVEAMQPFMEQAANQRRFSSSLTQSVIKECFVNYSKSITSASSEKENRFVKKCSELCWTMCAKEPPMKLEYKGLEDQTIDSNKFNHYNRQGNIVQCVIWPVLLLYKGGPVLAKGTVQTYRKKSTKVGKQSAQVQNDEQMLLKMDEGEQQSVESTKRVNQCTEMIKRDKTSLNISECKQQSIYILQVEAKSPKIDVGKQGAETSLEISECKQQSTDIPEGEARSPEIDFGKQSTKVTNYEQTFLKIDEGDKQSVEVEKSVNQCTEMVKGNKTQLEISDCKQQLTDILEVQKYSLDYVGGKQKSATTSEQQSIDATTCSQKLNIEVGQSLQQSGFHHNCNTENRTTNVPKLSDWVNVEHTSDKKTEIEETLSANTERTPNEGEKYGMSYRNDHDRNDKEIGKESEFEKDENESEMNDKYEGYLRDEAVSDEQTNNTSFDNRS